MFFKKNQAKGTITSQIRISRCSSCGAILQSDDPKQIGYISPLRIEKNDEKGTCERCYSLRHYTTSNKEFSADYKKILQEATKKHSLIIYVLDLFAFESSLVPNIAEYLGDNVLVILNKRDILPGNVKDEDIIKETKRRLALEHIVPNDIMLLSSISHLNIAELFKTMNNLRQGKDVYFIGASLVGKSSLVTEMLRQYKNNTGRMITTRLIEGTYLDVLEVPLDETSTMYDTPGIFNPLSIVNQLERDAVKNIVPREEIVPHKFELTAQQALIIGAIGAVEFDQGEKTDFTFVMAKTIEYTRVKTNKLEKSFNTLVLTKQVKPVSERISGFKDLQCKEIKAPLNGNLRLYILGLGHLDFVGQGQVLKIYVPNHVGVKLIVND